MRTCIQLTIARSPRRLAGLAAAVTGLAARVAAAEDPPLELPPIEATPRKPTVQSSYQTWLWFTAQGPIRDPVFAFVDLVGGFYDDMHPNSLVVRPALGLRLPHRFSVAAGYSYSALWDGHHRRGEEHTPFEQVSYQAPFTGVDLFGRIRAEQRIRPGSDVGHRLRANVQVNVPLWHRAPVQAMIGDEIFLGLNRPADWQPQFLDFDLFFVGFGWDADKHFRAEVGYQLVAVPRPAETALIHCLSAGTVASW